MDFRGIIYGMALFTAGLVMSCNKDEEEEDMPPTAEQNITSSPWKLNAATAMGTNIIPLLPPCYIDNQLSFATGGTGTVAEGTNVCTPTTAGAFTWSLNADNTTLTTSTTIIPGGNGIFTVVSLSDEQMVLSQVTTAVPSPVPVTVTVTLVH